MTVIYPLNILLVSLAAGITFYLGFLPLKDVPRAFYVQQSFASIVLWGCAGFVSGLHTGGYIIGCGLMATTAWRQFCLERDFLAKLWLSGAGAFGGILCLLLLVRIPPCPEGASVWFITSIYFGVFVLTATYMAVALAFTASRSGGVSKEMLERALTFVFLAVGLRAVLLAGIVIAFPRMFPGWGGQLISYLTHVRGQEFMGWIGFGMVLPTAVALLSWIKLKQGATPNSLIPMLAAGAICALSGEFLARGFFF